MELCSFARNCVVKSLRNKTVWWNEDEDENKVPEPVNYLKLIMKTYSHGK